MWTSSWANGHHKKDDDGGNCDYYAKEVAIGKPAPDFKATAVINQEFKDISLADYKGKWVYLFFYPLDFTFVCPTEIIAFSERSAEFSKLNCEVIAASVDSKFSHLAWINTPRKEGGLGKMNIPIIADITKEISCDYGVLGDDGFTFRGSFLIDPTGVLRQITINDRPVGRSVDEALRLLKAFEYTEKHGEVCPVDWNEGKDSMQASPTGSKTYFRKANK